ncbi:MAG TPA: HlyD family efflux transporter periplasmic adaptor subunit [Allosphingosinicella sp.]|jgi:HlyD family secretion protein|nr:HlyD family efflux transporter periplasmic adaptor subunit [Allosphingosinicella sp.]
MATTGTSGFLGLSRRTWIFILIALLIGGYVTWQILSRKSLAEGFAAGNGRLEANELYIAAKFPGRIKEVLVNEGDTVEAGQVVARMDTEELEAQLRQALARIREARDAERVTRADVATKQSQMATRASEINAKVANLNYASQQYSRSRGLVKTGAVSEQEAQLDSSQMLTARAEVVGSRANLAAARAEVTGAQALVGRSASTIAAASAEADRIRAQIKDAVLVAPIRGRIESRLAEPGEVLGAGGRVYSLVDLSDVYMYVFMPEKVTGKLALGSEGRIVLDSAPQYPIRAQITYISPTAQFTPKTVETQEERHNLTFRVKLQIPRERLKQYEALVKAGVPGMGYVHVDEKAPWPADLQPPAKIPTNLWNPASQPKGQ